MTLGNVTELVGMVLVVIGGIQIFMGVSGLLMSPFGNWKDLGAFCAAGITGCLLVMFGLWLMELVPESALPWSRAQPRSW